MCAMGQLAVPTDFSLVIMQQKAGVIRFLPKCIVSNNPRRQSLVSSFN